MGRSYTNNFSKILERFVKMKKYLLIDIYNIFFRLVYAIQEKNVEVKSALVLNSLFVMMNFLFKSLEPEHLVFCVEGKNNWRKAIDKKYKANRQEKMDKRTKKEIEHDDAMLVVLDEFIEFADQYTNVTVLKCQGAEADDMIARFCYLHPDDKIIICSVDNDFVQLVNDNISLYNGRSHCLITPTGVYDMEDKHQRMKKVVIDNAGKVLIKKEYVEGVGSGLPDNWQEYALFCKCVRGDSSDNIFPAYPRASTKSTLKKGVKKVGVNEAFEHRKDHSYEWINFMNQTWKDIDGVEHKVEDAYKHNQLLIDFNCIPDQLKEYFDNYIQGRCCKKGKKMIGIQLSRFFNKYELFRLQDNINNYTSLFSMEY